MMKKLFLIMTLTLLWNCAPKYFLPLPKKNSSKERINKAKGFAEYFLNKCNAKDYSEIVGYDLDVNTRKFDFTSEKIEEKCKKINERYGKVTVGELNNAITYSRPTDYYDYFVFKSKLEKTDSLRYVVVGLYRDKDFIGGDLIISSVTTPKIVRKKKK